MHVRMYVRTYLYANRYELIKCKYVKKQYYMIELYTLYIHAHTHIYNMTANFDHFPIYAAAIPAPPGTPQHLSLRVGRHSAELSMPHWLSMGIHG